MTQYIYSMYPEIVSFAGGLLSPKFRVTAKKDRLNHDDLSCKNVSMTHFIAEFSFMTTNSNVILLTAVHVIDMDALFFVYERG